MTEIFEALALKIHVEIYDLDMAETIWPMSDEHDDEGVWMLKERADKMTDNQIGGWFLNKYLIDYGNTFEFTVTRGEVEMKRFRRNVKPINEVSDVCVKITVDASKIDVNLQVLENRVKAFNTFQGIRVGDYVRHLSGKLDRVTHVGPDSAQTGGGNGSYYLGEGGYLSYSGGLDPGIPRNKLVLTEEVFPGMIWFFSMDQHEAHNGIDFKIDFRVYNQIE